MFSVFNYISLSFSVTYAHLLEIPYHAIPPSVSGPFPTSPSSIICIPHCHQFVGLLSLLLIMCPNYFNFWFFMNLTMYFQAISFRIAKFIFGLNTSSSSKGTKIVFNILLSKIFNTHSFFGVINITFDAYYCDYKSMPFYLFRWRKIYHLIGRSYYLCKWRQLSVFFFFYFWGFLKSRVYVNKLQTPEAFKENIRQECKNLSPDVLTIMIEKAF